MLLVNFNIKNELSFPKHIPYQDTHDAYKTLICYTNSMKIYHMICLRSQVFKLINLVLLFSQITSLVTKDISCVYKEPTLIHK